MLANRDRLVKDYYLDLSLFETMNGESSLQSTLQALFEQDWELIRLLCSYDTTCFESQMPFLSDLPFICPVYTSNALASLLKEVKFIQIFNSPFFVF